MNNQKEKITNLTIFQGLNTHILEVKYKSGKVLALLQSNKPEKIIAIVNILKASNPNIWVTTFIKDTYNDIRSI